MVETVPGLGDGGGVAEHGHGAVDGGEGAVVGAGRWHGHGLLVVDAELEAGRAPLDQVEGRLGLEGGDGGVAVTGDDITTVQEGHGHVLSVAGVADNHLVVRLEAPARVSEEAWEKKGQGNILQGQVQGLEALVAALGGADDRRVADQGVVDSGVWDQVGLELV